MDNNRTCKAFRYTGDIMPQQETLHATLNSLHSPKHKERANSWFLMAHLIG